MYLREGISAVISTGCNKSCWVLRGRSAPRDVTYWLQNGRKASALCSGTSWICSFLRLRNRFSHPKKTDIIIGEVSGSDGGEYRIITFWDVGQKIIVFRCGCKLLFLS
jgi:hypothetical protein